jgi:hypothetical protein
MAAAIGTTRITQPAHYYLSRQANIIPPAPSPVKGEESGKNPQTQYQGKNPQTQYQFPYKLGAEKGDQREREKGTFYITYEDG